jgi:hypothetical protein
MKAKSTPLAAPSVRQSSIRIAGEVEKIYPDFYKADRLGNVG